MLEVAFGGGEPLLFKGFVPLLRHLSEQTSLGLNFTTNGILLTPEILQELGNAVGEIRVSAYRDNSYRRTLRLLANHRAGLNLLVTPANLRTLEVMVQDALRQGARNVLLLGYKGSDPSLHLSVADIEQLRQAVLRMKHLPLRLDICWYPLLSDLPHLFPRPDCGAGDEFLVITPDRAIQACSFHHERIPFETFEDLQRIYADLRSRRPAAAIGGCTRQQFVALGTPSPSIEPAVWMWRARSSNNSGDWTIVGRLRSAQLAQQAAVALRGLSRAHEAFLASPDGQAWIEEKEYYGSWPTPPLQEFGEAHGFKWSNDGEGLWWEEDGAGAPVLTAGAVGDAVVVYHPYCMGLPEEPFRKFFAAVGATEFGYWQYDRPSVIATATGNCPDALRAIESYLQLIDGEEHPRAVMEPPPWGAACDDSRLLDDEDRTTCLGHGPRAVQATTDTIRLVLTFENTFAGAIALEQWLICQGYSSVSLRIDLVLLPLAESPAPKKLPATKLFPEIQPIKTRIGAMSSAELIDALFAYHSNAPAALEDAVQGIPLGVRLPLARQTWRTRRKPGIDVDWRALLVIEKAGPEAADWMREIWPILFEENYSAMGVSIRALAAALPQDEAFALAAQWLKAAAGRVQYTERLKLFHYLANAGTLPLIEKWWEGADSNDAITSDWGYLAAASNIDWRTIRSWLESGRPLGLIALAALQQYAEKKPPESYRKPTRKEFSDALNAYQSRDAAPRAMSIIKHLLVAADLLTS